MMLSCGSTAPKIENAATASTASVPEPVPAYISWSIVKEYPHNTDAFTEGLEFHDGNFYEGTGEYGQSSLRKVELATGKVLQKITLEKEVFGEGITMFNGSIFQLTYHEGKCFEYDAKTLKLKKATILSYPECWGLTNNGTQLIMSDGTNTLHYLDLKTMKETRSLKINDENGPVVAINELEMIHGFIYANIWKKETIIKIDTATGKVVARADLTGIRERGGIAPFTRRGTPEVLNGIAFDEKENRIFVTGKNWPKIFEIKLDN